MSNPFFDHPILNSPYEMPQRHWELDAQGQPTQQIMERRRRAEFITPIPKPKKRRASADQQAQIVFDEGKGLSTAKQQYDPTSIINELRGYPQHPSHHVTWTGIAYGKMGGTCSGLHWPIFSLLRQSSRRTPCSCYLDGVTAARLAGCGPFSPH